MGYVLRFNNTILIITITIYYIETAWEFRYIYALKLSNYSTVVPGQHTPVSVKAADLDCPG
jgi:hypothetical protein